ncbi:peroxisomal acyl-coenzyme A oxidase 1-like [Ptychodera flava]|uniref:peroxisomal acyl-coenzyme A oxidase 1-like n=1 Tax=Ptychodera flava TaxID=63121 RepID=UPI00396A2257
MRIDPDGTYHPPISDKIVYAGMMLSRAVGGEEPQIIDYQSQQLKLFPQMAEAYAFRFAAHNIRTRYDHIQSDIRASDISGLQELHGLSAGMKAYQLATNWGLEVLRLSCGGHGYSQASGFSALYGTFTGGVTAEGEYSVLMLQTARYLVKCVAKATSGEKLPHSIAYLTAKPEFQCPAKSENDILDLEVLLVNEAARQLHHGIQAGKPQHEAWNDSHVYLIKAADDGYMSGELTFMVTNQVAALLAVIRPNAVALVDAFDIPDEMLGSILGRYDGNVYENLYNWAKESPLNQTEVHHSYSKYLKALLKANPVDAKL